MADKNDARELHPSEKARQWLKENFMPEYLAKENGTLVSVVGLLEHYAASVTQERDALRRTLKSRMMDYEPYIAPLREEQKHLDPNTPERAYWHYGYSSALADVLRQLEPRAAAEESQPK